MKSLRKTILLLLLFSYILPWNMSLAAEENVANDRVDQSVVSEFYTMATIREGSNTYDLPHRDIFINTVNPTDNVTMLSSQGTRELFGNGFWYESGYSVKTRGQIDVSAYASITDFSETAREEELETMQRVYPGAYILDVPTSAYNCHSFAWCEEPEWNMRWIGEVDLFVSDVHTFKPVDEAEAQAGDVVLYFDVYGEIAHSAVITQISDSGIICKSKWGASVLCEHALEYVPSTYKKNGECVCLIVRKTEHTGTCVASGVNRHTRTCTICSYEETLSCEYEYTYFYDDMHNASCKYCSNGYAGAFCTFDYTSNGNGTHAMVCTACGNAYTNSCSFTTEYSGNGQHLTSCSQCGAGSYNDCSDMFIHYEDETGDWHKYACAVCGHESGSDAEACTFGYVFYGVVDDRNAHVYACITCGHVDSGPAACLCIGVNPCALCGHVNDHISLGIEEEELVE